MQFKSFQGVVSMQSNTAAVRIQPVNSSNYSVENRKPDLFTIADGHYIGHDGFVVPKNFDEFHERFPQYVRNWVNRHVDGSTQEQDVEDWTQDLLIHLRYLPAISKHREAGKEDVVQTFDPCKHFGASSARFFNYINLCLGNKFRTIYAKRTKNPLCRLGNLSLSTHWEETDRDQVGDEFCHAHSAHLRKRCERQKKQHEDRHLIGEFVDFVRREDSGMVPAMEAIFATGNPDDAAQQLKMRKADVCRTRARLCQLGTCFLNGERVPRQRRPYKRRVSRNRTTALTGERVAPVTTPLIDPRIDPCKGGDDFDQTFAGAVLSESTQLGSLTVGG
jgi:hypothetical protein